MTTFTHIPTAVMAAINSVGLAHHTLDAAYTVVRKAYVADKLSADDGKVLLAMALKAHLPRKYVGQITPEGVVRNSALYMQVRRIWSKEIEQSVAETVLVRVSGAEREAYDALVASIAKANAAFVRLVGDRAGAVRKTMAARKAAK
jgi:hypothetical protein